jgi:hypothetical protein
VVFLDGYDDFAESLLFLILASSSYYLNCKKRFAEPVSPIKIAAPLRRICQGADPPGCRHPLEHCSPDITQVQSCGHPLIS